MSSRGWIFFGVIVFGFVGLMFYLSNSNKINLEDVDPYQILTANEDNGQTDDHVYGNKNAELVLIEWADFQCPGCATANKRFTAITEDYKDQLAFVFRNYTSDGHPNALSAAAAVESANLQGKFWEMKDLVFANQSEWAVASSTDRDDLYKKYAAELDLDEEKFIEGMKSQTVRKKIEFDKALARKINLDATPYFTLDGEKIGIDVWGDDDKFRQLIDDKLKEKGISLPESAADN